MAAGGGGHGGRALPDLVSRLRIDDSDIPRAEKSAANFSNAYQRHMGKAGAATSATSQHVEGLHGRLQKLGPVGATVSKRFEEWGITSKVAAGGLIGLAAAAALVAVKMGFDAAHAASDLNEQLSAVQVTFGSASQEIVDFGEKAATNLGLSETAALKGAATFGNLFKNVGATDEATARYSKALVGLAGDIASFKNLDPQDVLEKLRMGLTGQLDVLRDLGVFIDDNVVQQKVLQMGMEKTTASITEGEKVIARYNLILEQTSDAQGDLGRTADSAANMERNVGAQADNLKTKVGAGLLPVLQLWLTSMGLVVDGASHVVDAVQQWNKAMTMSGNVAGQGIATLERLGSQLMSAAAAHQRGQVSTTDYSGATAKSTDIQKQYAAKLKEVETALATVNTETLKGFSTDLAYQQSVLASKDAVSLYIDKAKEAADATRAYGAKSTQAADAAEELRKAQLGAQQAALSQAEAAAENAKQQAELRGQTFTARDAMLVERDALQQVANQLAPGSPLRVSLESYIATLQDRIPKEVITHFQVYFSSQGAISTSGDYYIPRASGGPVMPGYAYTVGEYGPEKLYMGRNGGYIVPDRSGPSASPATTYQQPITVNVTQPNASPWQIARELAWAMKTATA